MSVLDHHGAPLEPVSRTALVPLVGRARDCLRSRSLLRDVAALRVAERLGCLSEAESTSAYWSMIRTALIDQIVSRSLHERSPGCVVELGCGLNTRFERLDDGGTNWLEVDLPEVIRLRRSLLAYSSRRTMVGCSVLDPAWVGQAHDFANGRPTLVVLEGVLMYLGAGEISALLQTLSHEFPGSSVVFDYATPAMAAWQNQAFAAHRSAVRFTWSAERAEHIAVGRLRRVLTDDSLARLAKQMALRLTPRWRLTCAIAAIVRRALLHGHRLAHLSE